MSNSTGKSRFICRVVRLQTALSGHAAKTTGHAAHCPDCQAYFSASSTLITNLRRAAAHETQGVPNDLAGKIALAVRQSAPRPKRSRRPVALPLFAGATVALAMAVFIVRENLPIRSTAPRTVVSPELSSSDVAGIVSDVDQLRIRFLNSVEPTATKLAAQNPLTQELNSVQADARSALGFLAINFLPSGSAQTHDPEKDSTRG